MNEDERDREFQEAMKDEEAQITSTQGDHDADGVLTDFYIKPYKGLHDVEEEDEAILPMFYFDNDDGFWDSYIEKRVKKWEEHPMLVNRQYIKV